MFSYFKNVFQTNVFSDFSDCFHLTEEAQPQQYNIPRFERYIPNQKRKCKDKKTLVLDLDETLIHSQVKEFNCDFSFELMGKVINVKKRPGLSYFLEEMSKYYEIIVFTSSIFIYAKQVIKRIDPNHRISYIFDRSKCFLTEDGKILKDLRNFGNRDLKDIIIIDNNPIHYDLQQENGLEIKSFFDEDTDDELEKLTPFLRFMSLVPDIRYAESKLLYFINNSKLKLQLQKQEKESVIDKNVFYQTSTFQQLLVNNNIFQPSDNQISKKINFQKQKDIQSHNLINSKQNLMQRSMKKKKSVSLNCCKWFEQEFLKKLKLKKLECISKQIEIIKLEILNFNVKSLYKSYLGRRHKKQSDDSHIEHHREKIKAKQLEHKCNNRKFSIQ